MVFTDAFQGAYKNGTNGTRDCRWFAVIYPSTRILWYITYALTLSSFCYVLITISLIGVVVLIIVVQPYKKACHNKIDSLFMLTLAVHTASLTSISLSVERQHTQSHTALILVVLSGTLPLLYLTVILLHWVYHCKVFASPCKMCKQVHICHTRERHHKMHTHACKKGHAQDARAHGCKSDHTYIRPFACRSDSSGLWPGCLLCVWVANMPWMPVASSRVNQMPPEIAVNLGLRADANPIMSEQWSEQLVYTACFNVLTNYHTINTCSWHYCTVMNIHVHTHPTSGN